MANRGWESTQSGTPWPSNARTTGRVTGTGDAESFIKGSEAASTGLDNDPMGSRDDLFEAPGPKPSAAK